MTTRAAVALLFGVTLLLHGTLPAQFFDRDAVMDGSIDASGALVAYTMREADVTNDRFRKLVYVVAAQGGAPQLIGAGHRPAFASVGNAIARLSDTTGRTTLLVRDGAGGVDRELGSVDVDISAFRWSPDGTRLAFAAEQVIPLGTARLAQGGDFNRRLSLYVVDVAGGSATRLTQDDFAVGPAEPELPGLVEFDWLDNGRLVVSGRLRGSEESPHGASLFVIDVANRRRGYLAGAGGRWHLPRVSPDGDWIAFTGQALGSAGWMASELLVLRPDGSGLRRLTVGLDRDALDLAWANDSRTIWFATEDRGSRNIQRVDSRNGRLGVGSSGTHILSLEAVADRGNWALAVRRTQHSAGTLVRFPLARPHELMVMIEAPTAEFTGEIEELDLPVGANTLHAWLIRPPSFTTDSRWPLVIDLHGGPHSMAGAGYAPDALAFAAAGMLVLRINARGSTGFGYDIVNGLGDRWPGSDVSDVRAAVDALVERGLVDSNRVSVVGSGAGAVTAAALRQADTRIRSLVMHCSGDSWLVGGSGYDPPHWSEWFAARPFLLQASRWWERTALTLRGTSTAPVLVVAASDGGDFGVTHSRELALQGVQTQVVSLPGHCADAGPETQAAVSGRASTWLLSVGADRD